MPFQDAALEKLYAFARMLLRKLPRPGGGGPLDIDQDVLLAVLDHKVAAGRFSAPAAVEEVPQHAEIANPSAYAWVAIDGATKPAPRLFVAQVVGQSMNEKRSPTASSGRTRSRSTGPNR
ncbi:MAG: hypothetical protein IT385_14740 [Deltaproteobacteria bacterium]|nr:hypothetical protein [Deltaproteobacteria bacterium]